MVRNKERTTSRKPPGTGRQGRGGTERTQKGHTDSGKAATGDEPRPDARRAVDALFRLPVSEFTAARNALAGRLKKGGRAEEAEAVRTLPRPSLAAWTVNQLYWDHREAFDRLIATGERFYDAQVAQLSGSSADIRGALDARREALSGLSRLAADLLRTAGHAATPDTMRRVTTTLEALSSFGSAPLTSQAGRLTEEVLPPGFEALAPLVTRVGGDAPPAQGPTRVLPFRAHPPAEAQPSPEHAREAALAAAAAAVEQAEHDLQHARLAAQQAEATLKQAAARAKETEMEKVAAEARFVQLAAVAEEARTEALRIAAQAEDAAQVLDEAERARDAAQATLRTLGAEAPSGG